MTASTPTPAPRELQLRAARARLVSELGADRIAALQRTRLSLDIASIAGALALFLACAWKLGTGSVREPLWWLALFVQGNLVLILAFINHDAFVHRKLFPPRLRWVLSSILLWPSQIRGAAYEELHLTHHRQLGTDKDTERYKHEIDTPLRRLLYATPAAMVFRTLFFGEGTSSVNLGGGTARRDESQRQRWERATRIAVWVAVAAAAAWDWRLVVFGYLLPFAVVTPVLNTMRIVLEHFDLDRDNALWVGTFYRTGPLTRLMFWWDAGDCHLVHHFYANIPWYHMNAALRAMRPVLQRHGVQEQRSLPRLLWQWFTGARAHWSLPPEAAGFRPPAA